MYPIPVHMEERSGNADPLSVQVPSLVKRRHPLLRPQHLLLTFEQMVVCPHNQAQVNVYDPKFKSSGCKIF